MVLGKSKHMLRYNRDFGSPYSHRAASDRPCSALPSRTKMRAIFVEPGLLLKKSSIQPFQLLVGLGVAQ